jgi:hypothetical protein
MDRGQMGDASRTKPAGSTAVGHLQCAGYQMSATRETSGGNCDHESMKSVDTSTVRMQKHC